MGIIKRIFAAFISIFLFFPISVSPWYSYDTDAKMTAIVMSDTHMEGNNTQRFSNLGKGFANAFASNEKPDAVVFVGDQTMNCQTIEWTFFYGFLYRFGILDRTIMAFGNHDFGNSDSAEDYEKLSARAIKEYNDYCDKDIDKVYYSTVVNGFKFIVLGSEANCEDTVQYISDEQIEWLKAEMAAENGKPVFVVNHNLIYGKNGERSYYYFNQIDNGDKLCAALEGYDGKVIYISGHSHFGVNESTVKTFDNVTYINMPSFGNEGNYDAEDEYSSASIGMIIEGYDSHIKLTFKNFIEQKDLEGYTFDIAY